MAYDDYIKAQKLALKAYKSKTLQGGYPYLPVLDEILSHVHIEREENLGTINIPAKQVIGTSSAGRTQAFAYNFMPLLNYGSEFSVKWSLLYDAQIQEGIHTPIKVYEFLNKYYVIEGNKRTSVLKYVGSPTIPAEVIRKVPRLTEDKNIQIYYEFMDFYKNTKINYVVFSEKGSYQKLCRYIGKGTDEQWTEDDCMNFSSFHVAFYGAYKAMGGNEIKGITDDDALLFYLSLYPYSESRDKLTSEIKKDLSKIWTEIKTLGEEKPVELLTVPNTETSMIKKMQSPKVHKVAFVYDVKPSESDWIYGQEMGRKHIIDTFHGDIDARAFIATPYEDDEEILRKLCEEGYDIIFAIAPMFVRACIKVAPLYPNTKILNCSLNSPHASIRTYGIRIYEGKLLLGMLAASLSEKDDIGYLADYPIYGVIPGINAFALGARMINPRAKVHLLWSTMKDCHSDEYFLQHGISMISSQNMISPTKEDRTLGLYHLSDKGTKNIATTVYQWGAFYVELINSIMRGSWKTDMTKEPKALNYWWGLSANVLDVILGSSVPDNTKRLINFLKGSIANGSFPVFSGILYDTEHNLRCGADETLAPEDVMMMDWLIEGIVGEIPTIDQLSDHAKDLVRLRGLKQTLSDQERSLV